MDKIKLGDSVYAVVDKSYIIQGTVRSIKSTTYTSVINSGIPEEIVECMINNNWVYNDNIFTSSKEANEVLIKLLEEKVQYHNQKIKFLKEKYNG